MRFESKGVQNEKKCVLQFEKHIFFAALFVASSLALHFKNDL
jgi:hypothetical protein